MTQYLGRESEPGVCDEAYRLLKEGETISFVGEGYSMHPIIPNRTVCKVIPWTKGEVKEGDAVYCRMWGVEKGKVVYGYLLHYVWEHDESDDTYLIGWSPIWNKGQNVSLDGWVTREDIVGKYDGPDEDDDDRRQRQIIRNYNEAVEQAKRKE